MIPFSQNRAVVDHLWPTDEQFARIAPHLPTDTRGKESVEDRRANSGIVQVLKSGGRWSDAPREIFGPKKTFYKRFVSCSAKGIWIGLVEKLAQADGPPKKVLIDFPAVKAHRCASGGKAGLEPGDPPLAWRTQHQDPRAYRSARAPLAFLQTGGEAADCTAGALLLERIAACSILLADEGFDSDAIRRQIEVVVACPQHPAQDELARETSPLARALPRSQRNREDV